MRRRYEDRLEAGQILADRLSHLGKQDDVVVLGLPRGGVPVADVIARQLGAPLDVILVRKVGLPGQEELAIGAVATGDVFVRNNPIIAATGLSESLVTQLSEQKKAELRERRIALVGNRELASVEGMTVIVVDDGVATGSTMRAAIAALRQREPRGVVVAVPVCAADAFEDLRHLADEVVCPLRPTDFQALSLWYRNFDQVSDETVRDLLAGT